MHRAVEQLTAAVDAVAGLDPHALPDAALVEALEQLLTLESRLRAVQARWLAAADARDATVAETGRAARSWLIEECRLGPAEAGRRVRLARALPAAPEVAAAFAGGEVTAEHASTIVGLLPSVAVEHRAPVEQTLVELARTQPPHVLARAVDQVLVMLGVEPDADAAYARRYGERGVDLAETFAGYGSLAGTLTPEVRETLRVALDAAVCDTGPDDPRNMRQRRHDALGEIAAFYLSHTDTSDDAGQARRVVITIGLDTLLAGVDPHVATFDSGLPVTPQTARRLACDAELIPAVLGTRSEVLDIGRASRTFTHAIRRAARLRDGGRCAYGSCRRRIVELHHIIWWSHGGHTSLDNAAWLCTFHHWLVHEGGWTMRRLPDGGYAFTAPNGHEHRFPRQPMAA